MLIDDHSRSDCYLAAPGLGRGNYPTGQDAEKMFDRNTSTKYLNIGVCDSENADLSNVCGVDTGLYLSPRGGLSLLLAFRFWTTDSYRSRDPFQITVEASNRDPSMLSLGSSWTLIYNDTSGMDIVAARFTPGQICSLFINANVYSSWSSLSSENYLFWWSNFLFSISGNTFGPPCTYPMWLTDTRRWRQLVTYFATTSHAIGCPSISSLPSNGFFINEKELVSIQSFHQG